MRKGELPEQGAMSSQLTKEAIKYFKSPAVICQICGEAMTYTRDFAKWERKWSMHRPCYEAQLSSMDRMTGIASERQQASERAKQKEEAFKKRYGLE